MAPRVVCAMAVMMLPSVASAFMASGIASRSQPTRASIAGRACPAAPVPSLPCAKQSVVNDSSWRVLLGAGVAFCAATVLGRCGPSVTMYHFNPRKAFRKRRNKPYFGVKYKALVKTIEGGGQDKQLGYRISGAPGHPGSPHGWTEPIRWAARFKRRIHIRRKIEGTCARPRLAVYRSKEHMHVNIIDDTIGTGVTLVSSSTKQKAITEEIRNMQGAEPKQQKTWTEAAAEVVGKDVAQKCLEKNITMVVFDRGGFPYAGRVKALAEAARSAGLQF